MPKPAKTPAAKRTRKPRKPDAKPAEKPAPIEPGTLVPSSTGRGKIRHGSKPGTNRGGSGRPASAIRERLRGSFDARVTILEEIADAGEQDSDRLKAMDLMAKYGLGKEVSVEDIKARLSQTLDIIDEECSRDVAARVRERMRPVWR